MSLIDDIKEGVLAVDDKLDTLKAGKDVETAFLIERVEDKLRDIVGYDLDEIEKAMK